MTDPTEIDAFLNDQPIAVIGVSRDRAKYGHQAFFNLKAKGYRVLAVNPRVDAIGRNPVYPSLAALPERPGGVVTVIPPAATEELVREAARLGIRRVWMQPGSESVEAVRFCRENGIQVIVDECVMLHARPLKTH